MQEFKPINGDLFHFTRTVLHINEPGYRVWLTNLGNGEMLVQEEWPDVQALLDHNAEEAAEFSRTSKLGDCVKVASVPVWKMNQWEAEGARDKEVLRRKLNDPDNAKFRTNGLRL